MSIGPADGILTVDAAELAVFPSAVGFGSDTIGGRYGRIIEVTNLNNTGTGSLREACVASGPRIVIFRTGGTIRITSNIKISNPYITIAGQSAPGDGITVRGASLTIATHDVVVRDIRIRVGDDSGGPSPDNRDGVQIENQNNPPYNIVLDHLSVSWAIDESLTLWWAGAHDVTINNCIISEALYDSLHSKGPHSMGSLVGLGISRVSYIGNLFVHNNDRNPRFRGNSGVIVNNVNYDIGWRNANISGGTVPQQVSVVGNLYMKGASSYGSLLPIHLERDIVSGSKIYVADNKCSDYTTGNCYRIDTGFSPLVDSPQSWPAGLVAKPSSQVLDWVLANAGARLTGRDSVDLRVINDVRNKTGRMINTTKEVGGWPALNPGTPPATLTGMA